MHIDYSPLTQPVTKEDIRAYSARYKQPFSALGPIAIGVFGLLLALFIVEGAASGEYHSTIPLIVFFVLPVILISCLIALSNRAGKKRRARLYKFALANNVELTVDRPNTNYVGMIFDEGHSRMIKEALLFPDGREIGNYMYVTGSGKNRTTHSWGYIRVKLSRRLPHMVLDAKSNNLLKRFSNLPDGFNKSQTLSLEGNFNDYFTLYAPKEYERDALYVFTPDVMAAVIDAGARYDIEVIDDTLILYASIGLQIDNETQLQNMMRVVDTISGELKDQSKYYADERVGDRSLNSIAAQGYRLKSGVKIGTIIATIGIIIYAILSVVSTFR